MSKQGQSLFDTLKNKFIAPTPATPEPAAPKIQTEVASMEEEKKEGTINLEPIDPAEATELLLKFVSGDQREEVTRRLNVGDEITTQIDALINAGADFNQKDSSTGLTPLMTAIEKKDIETAEALISIKIYAGRELKSKAERGLDISDEERRKATLDLNLTDPHGNTPLKQAALSGLTRITTLLISHTDADANIANNTGTTALMSAVGSGHLESVQLLVAERTRKGRDYLNLDLQDQDGNTALIRAISERDQNIAYELIKAGANPDLQNKEGNTALMISAQNGLTEVTSTLVQIGADLNIRNHNGATALMLSISGRNPGITEILAEKTRDLNLITDARETAIMLAAKEGQNEMIEILARKGAKLNIPNKVGNTALMQAIEKGHQDTARILIERKAQLNLWNKDGNTALMIATKKRDLGVIEAVIKGGADPHLQSRDNKTAIELAAKEEATREEKEEVVSAIIKSIALAIARRNGRQNWQILQNQLLEDPTLLNFINYDAARVILMLSSDDERGQRLRSTLIQAFRANHPLETPPNEAELRQGYYHAQENPEYIKDVLIASTWKECADRIGQHLKVIERVEQQNIDRADLQALMENIQQFLSAFIEANPDFRVNISNAIYGGYYEGQETELYSIVFGGFQFNILVDNTEGNKGKIKGLPSAEHFGLEPAKLGARPLGLPTTDIQFGNPFHPAYSAVRAIGDIAKKYKEEASKSEIESPEESETSSTVSARPEEYMKGVRMATTWRECADRIGQHLKAFHSSDFTSEHSVNLRNKLNQFLTQILVELPDFKVDDRNSIFVAHHMVDDERYDVRKVVFGDSEFNILVDSNGKIKELALTENLDLGRAESTSRLLGLPESNIALGKFWHPAYVAVRAIGDIAKDYRALSEQDSKSEIASSNSEIGSQAGKFRMATTWNECADRIGQHLEAISQAHIVPQAEIKELGKNLNKFLEEINKRFPSFQLNNDNSKLIEPSENEQQLRRIVFGQSEFNVLVDARGKITNVSLDNLNIGTREPDSPSLNLSTTDIQFGNPFHPAYTAVRAIGSIAKKHKTSEHHPAEQEEKKELPNTHPRPVGGLSSLFSSNKQR